MSAPDPARPTVADFLAARNSIEIPPTIPAAAPKHSRAGKIFGIIVLVLLALTVVSLFSHGDSTPPPVAPSTAQAPAVEPAPVAPAPAKPAPKPVPAGPREGYTFGAGVWTVGENEDIAPGTYHTDGPANGNPSGYYARLNATDGEFDSIIANKIITGPTTVTIKKSDVAFETFGVKWEKVTR